ncbi:MAG: hypothetical protein M3O71_13565 [Bacteroidota bacterium]|nr:hypothetical protein [Bacteroidota bacterium]
MEERKTAAIVLSIIALITIFYTAILPEIRYRSTQTISFKTCSIDFKYVDKGLVTDVYRAANNKLALCLCGAYQQKHDTAIANRIFKIYREYGSHYGVDSVSNRSNRNIDSIIRNRKAIFDTLILID